MHSLSDLGRYVVESKKLDCLKAISSLEPTWIALEKKSSASFFLSWYWIKSWLQTCVTEVDVIEVSENDRVVALALIVGNRQRRHSIFTFSSIHLNHTGDATRDQIWPEYSGVLVSDGNESAIYNLVIRRLCESSRQWDEFYSGVMDQSRLNLFINNGLKAGLWCRKYWEAKGFLVDLDVVRGLGKSYLDSLSKNTRSQIRRSQKLLNSAGDFEFCTASTLDEALVFLEEIGELHKERWEADSGFFNASFLEFHQLLVKNNFELGVIQLAGIRMNGKLIAGLYNFIYADTVLFYLSGVVREDDNRIKIGLLAHALCIQQHLDNGLKCYDFMGGDMRYKKSLSNTEYCLGIAVLEKPGLKIGIEHMARKVKSVFRKFIK